MQKMKKPLVEVIILHHEGLEIIKNCLDSLKKTKYKNLKVTLLNQACEDGSNELVKKKYPWVNLIVSDKNESFTKANNLMLKQSRAEYCVLLNDDTEQDKDWISELASFAGKNKDFATLQPKVLSLKNKKMFENAGAGGGFLDIYGYPLCRGRIFGTIEEDAGQYDDSIETFWNCGVALLINMRVVKKIGYLDEYFGSYGEEIDFCWRALKAGYKNYYVNSSRIYHIGSNTWRKNILKKEYLIHRNANLVLIKNYSSKNLAWVLPIKFFLELITFARFIFDKPIVSLAVLKSLAWFLIHPLEIIRKHSENHQIKKIEDKEIMKKMVKHSIAALYFVSGKRKFINYEKYLPLLKK